MTDEEMLKLAAKAAGLRIFEHAESKSFWVAGPKVWNPLVDDDDALRLAVACDISIGIEKTGAALYLDKDEMAVVRLAIVRAAAELGSRSNALLSRPAGDEAGKNDTASAAGSA